MDSTAISLDTTFTLSVLSNLLDGFRPPAGPFDPVVDWEQSYAVATVGQVTSARVGRLRIQRRNGGSLLNADYEVTGPANTVHRERAEIQRQPGAWGAPLRWKVRWGTYTQDDRPVAGTCWSTTAVVTGNEIRFTDKTGKRRLPLPASFTLRWLLFDLVQQLPQAEFSPRRITLLDETGGSGSEVTLTLRKTITLAMGGKPVMKQEWRQLKQGRIRHTFWGREGDQPATLTAYSLVGQGTVPWMFWVDTDHRLLAATVGLEAFILEPPGDTHPGRRQGPR